MATNHVDATSYLIPIMETKIELVLQEKGLLDALMQRYDERLQKFKIGKSLLCFRTEDVAIILSLQCDGDIVVFNRKKT